LDAKKALKMFEKVQVPVLGLVENMAVHVCTNCGHAEHIFGKGGGERMAAAYGVPLLGSLPLEIAIREQGDAGTPIVAAAPDSGAAGAYGQLARNIVADLDTRPRAAAPISASLVWVGATPATGFHGLDHYARRSWPGAHAGSALRA